MRENKENNSISPIRGVWITNRPHSQVLVTKDNIVEAIAFLDRIGFNTIFPVVWTRGYTLFPSQTMAKYGLTAIDPFYQQQRRDPVAEIIEVAHGYNIRVIPWFEYGFAASYRADGGHILQKYPQWAAKDAAGKWVRAGGLVWLNALDEQVQQFVLELILEVVRNYRVEGIQGCDRLPALPVTAGYNCDILDYYPRNPWREHPPQPQNPAWVQWRADILTNFLFQIYQQVKAVNPNSIVSISPAVYPFCLSHLLQDPVAWLNLGIVDWLHPQLYRPTFVGYRQQLKQICKYFEPNYWSKIAPGIALKANNQNLSSSDLAKCIELNRRSGFGGEIIFYYDGLKQYYSEST